MSRRNNGPIGDLISVLVQLPWWVGVIAAALFAIGGEAVASKAASGTLDPFALQMSNLTRIFLRFVAAMCLVSAVVSALKSVSRRRLLDRQSDLNSLKDLSWREFEHLVGEAYRRQGYAIEETGGGGADGGIDLILRGRGQNVLVQCKQWRQQQVGVDKVRELYGVVCAERADHGILVTSGRYTKDAISFQVGKPLTLVDGPALAALVAGVRSSPSPVPAQSVPAPVTQTQPTSSANACPQCGARMILRTAKRGSSAGSQFYGCTNYPDCRGIRQLS